MKIKKITVALLACVLVLSSCEKDQSEQDANNIAASQAQLHKLAEDFQTTQKNNLTARWPKWIRVIIADAVGAMAGAGLGGPVGAVIAGTATSVGAACDVVSTGKTAFTPTPNPANPFDSQGILHYQTLAAAYVSPSNYTNGSTAFNATVFNNFQLGFIKGHSTYSQAQLDAGLANSQQPYALSLLPSLTDDNYKTIDQTMYTNGKITLVVKQTMDDYFYSLDVSRSLADFVAYSKTAEATVNSSSFTQHDKDVILLAMATTRHGAAYWQ